MAFLFYKSQKPNFHEELTVSIKLSPETGSFSFAFASEVTEIKN